MSFCHECGAKVAPDDPFCGNCGAVQLTVPAPQSAALANSGMSASAAMAQPSASQIEDTESPDLRDTSETATPAVEESSSVETPQETEAPTPAPVVQIDSQVSDEQAASAAEIPSQSGSDESKTTGEVVEEDAPPAVETARAGSTGGRKAVSQQLEPGFA